MDTVTRLSNRVMELEDKKDASNTAARCQNNGTDFNHPTAAVAGTRSGIGLGSGLGSASSSGGGGGGARIETHRQTNVRIYHKVRSR